LAGVGTIALAGIDASAATAAEPGAQRAPLMAAIAFTGDKFIKIESSLHGQEEKD
jgi:hypothetical protein